MRKVVVHKEKAKRRRKRVVMVKMWLRGPRLP